MKLNQVYSDRIAKLPQYIQESIMKEAPHTRIDGAIPDEWSFLNGAFVDLGFENYMLPQAAKQTIYKGFISDGVAIPNSAYKLRYTRTGVTTIEKRGADENLALLPDDWFEAILVLGDNNEIIYQGSLVRPDQVI
ncbi:MAG: hypothetical protein ACYSYU_00110 [Planctomycetota bacterium]|jgi:hypothetical protein